MPAPLLAIAGHSLRRLLLRRLAKVALVALPVVVVAGAAVALLAVLVLGGSEGDQDRGYAGGQCSTVTAATAVTVADLTPEQVSNAQTIVVNDKVAGYVTSWEQDGMRLVAYWIGREYWGRGIARAALQEFLENHEHHRPIYAYVALSNARSIRVLEKCGFRRAGEPFGAADGVAEALFVIDATTGQVPS